MSCLLESGDIELVLVRHPPALQRDDAVGRATTLGLNYFLDGHFSKRQLNYLRNDGRGHTSDDQLVLAMQAAF